MTHSVAINAMRLQEESCGLSNGGNLSFPHNGLMDLQWIRDGLKKPGKTQRGLAAALGVDPAAITRLLAGKRQLKASEIEKARVYLDSKEPAKVPYSSATIAPQTGTADLIRVLGMAECGPDGWSLWNGETVDMVSRPPSLAGVPNGYAVFVTGDSMSPRYHPGEMAYIHPGRPVTPGSYVLVQMQPDEGGERRAFLKRLVRRSGNRVILEQYEPKKTFTLKAEEILSMHKVVGSGEP